MAKLKDSGKRREFSTGAVRDAVEGKGRCDLLPLEVLSEFFQCDGKIDMIFFSIEQYIRDGDLSALFRALEAFDKMHWKSYHTMILEVSHQYEDGMQKYGERNWEKGIHLHCYMDSAVRHYLKFLRGDDDEPHDRAFVWNILGAIWTHKNKPELIDLPFAEVITTLYSDDKEVAEFKSFEPPIIFQETPDHEIVCRLCDQKIDADEYISGVHFCPKKRKAIRISPKPVSNGNGVLNPACPVCSSPIIFSGKTKGSSYFMHRECPSCGWTDS